MCVPLRSPRDTNGAFASAIRFSAAAMSFVPATFAGSAFGPISTKSLYMTSRRPIPQPSATNLSSAGRSCTNTTSASPRRPTSSAWPVPSATTFTWMPVFCVNIGRMWPKRPDCSVDVVDATTIDFGCAAAGSATSAASAAANSVPIRRRR